MADHPAYLEVQAESTPVVKPVEHEANDFSNNSIAIAYRKLSYWWSSALLIFALFITYYDICKDWVNDFDDNGAKRDNVTGDWTANSGAEDTPPAVNFIFFTLLLVWVALLEGAQVSIVGLSTVDIETFKDTHPRSYAVCKLVHAGANVERFIVGRQFLLLFIVFVISRMGGHSLSRVKGDDYGTNNGNFYIGDWKWDDQADQAFLQNSILLMIVIIIPGQLISQLLALPKMLDFLELPYAPMYTIALPSLAVEAIGLTHCAYLIKDMAANAAGIKTEDDGHQIDKNIFHWIRVFYSVVIVIFAAVVVVKGLLSGQTAVWETLPGYGALLLCIFFLFFIGCCEGFQISVMKLAKLPSSQLRTKYPTAYRTITLLFTGRNSQAFMIGRQVFVAMMMVILGRSTSFKDRDDDVFGFPMWFKDGFLTTGILGAIFVVNVGQLSFRMLATAFPVIFLNNYVMYVLLRIGLLVEMTGIFNAVWPLTWFLDSCLGLKDDPFSNDEETKTDAQNILDRKKSMGIPTTEGLSPFDVRQPEVEHHAPQQYTYTLSSSTPINVSRSTVAEV